MESPKTNEQETLSQLKSVAVTQPVTQPIDTTQSIKLRRQRNGQYTGSLIG
ncbi:hypothetical protein [Anabaena azotica]|uniref:Anacyclamide n=1 Tax=Anabaena azotica FACHB-119 TaxID=947527 RepID=A0ABR8D602_9NOST|nr:hypothetical protein [Anabaena azotica]MBD2501576.1 hypothetical protein [Anabaena azotica FACHB-119]